MYIGCSAYGLFSEKIPCLEKVFSTLENFFSRHEKSFSRHEKKFSRHEKLFSYVGVSFENHEYLINRLKLFMNTKDFFALVKADLFQLRPRVCVKSFMSCIIKDHGFRYGLILRLLSHGPQNIVCHTLFRIIAHFMENKRLVFVNPKIPIGGGISFGALL